MPDGPEIFQNFGWADKQAGAFVSDRPRLKRNILPAPAALQGRLHGSASCKHAGLSFVEHHKSPFINIQSTQAFANSN